MKGPDLAPALAASVYWARSKRLGRNMTNTALATRDNAAGAIAERVVILGDLSQLGPQQRSEYYIQVCRSLDLNPLTRPFSYLKLNGREILYANKDCSDQLRKRDKVSVSIVSREEVGELLIITARATLPDGRCDESIGALPLGKLQGEARANALMKCETKAKRRVTLSICGLGFLDETEIEGAQGEESGPQGTGGPLNPHAGPDEDPRAPAKASSEFDDIMSTMGMADRAVFDPACTWETMVHWRAIIGSKGEPSLLGKRLSKLFHGDEISPSQRKEMGALWNRLDRKLTSLEGKLKAPSVEASFADGDAADDDGDALDAFSPHAETENGAAG